MSIDKKNIIIIILAIIIVIFFIFIYIKFNNTESFEDIDYETVNTVENNTVITNNIKVHIYGCVTNEGVIELPEGSRIDDAINICGGATLDADLNKLNLAYILKDSEKLYVPSVNDEDDIETIVNSSSNTPTSTSTSNLININTATQTELETLSGIGPSTALKIIQYRNTNGKFTSIEDLKNVSGIGDAKFNSIKDSICV